MQDLYTEGVISNTNYQNKKLRHGNVLELLKLELAIPINPEAGLNVYKKGLKSIQFIEKHNIESNPKNKIRLVGLIFSKKFKFEKNKARTDDVNPLLLNIASINKGLQRNKKRDKSKKSDLSQLVPNITMQLFCMQLQNLEI